MRRLPIRWRLMVWHTAVMAVVVLAVGAGLYGLLRARLYQNFDEQLTDQAALTLASVRTDGGVPRLADNGTAGVPVDYVVRLVDAEGGVILDTGEEIGGSGVADLGNEVAAALGGDTRYSAHSVEDGETLRMISVPVRREPGGDIAGALQVGRDRAEIDEPLAELRRLLVIALPVMLAATAAGGYLLAARALAPVDEIAGLAGRIDATALHERLDLDLPDDELGRLARTFDAMLLRIEDAFERQRRFTADAAHEFRTPLAMMRSEIDLALHRPRTAEEYRTALQSLEGDLGRLTTLVTRLLTLARADAGHVVAQRSHVDLAAVVGVILDHYRQPAARANITLVDERAAAVAMADEDLLIQALVNLIDNALVHTPDGGRIAVGCTREPGRVRLWVQDTGRGIPADQQPHVFDRFHRVDTGRARQHGGVGLGLAIVRAIAEGHGGTVELTSEVGRGTRIALVIPDHVPPSR